jgi:hypothetical protein
MLRRLACVALALAAPAALLVPASPAAAERPIRWGAHPELRRGQTPEEALARIESMAGRRLGPVRMFYRWDEPWPTGFEEDLKGTGRTLVMSVKAKRINGSVVSWSSIANAQPGTVRYDEIRRWALRVRNYRARVWVTFNHEPEALASLKMGTSREYVAAWRQWVRIFRQAGATNARFMWIMTDQSFWLPASDRRQAEKWYPGDDWVEGIASDAYNWYTCRAGIVNPWKSLRKIINPQRRFWLHHQSEQLWLTEYATADDPENPKRKARWYRDARKLFKTRRFSVYDGVMLFEPSVGYPTCNWRPDVHFDADGARSRNRSAAAAWRRWGADPHYRR